MRAAALYVLVVGLGAAGCGFRVAATGDVSHDAPGSEVPAPDDATDGPPLPACMTNGAYGAGPDGHRYRKTGVTDYDGAIDTCTADGAHLVEIYNAAENSFVTTLGGADVWIGLDDLTTEGTFRWVNGSTSPYRNFGSGEPNDFTHEDCAYDRTDGTWNDTNCGDMRQAICECEPGYTPPPTPACRGMAGAVVHAGRKYFIHNTALTWAAAKADCEATGAYLAVISDGDEAFDVDNEFPGDSWLGLSDQATENTFVWVNGSPDGYRDWNLSTSSPHLNDTSRNCVFVNIAWTDTDCTATKRYACECDPAPP